MLFIMSAASAHIITKQIICIESLHSFQIHLLPWGGMGCQSYTFLPPSSEVRNCSFPTTSFISFQHPRDAC